MKRYFLPSALLLLVISLTILSHDAKAQPALDSRFGAVEAFWAQEEAADLGIGWERILFYWREIQPTGPEDWNTLHVLEEWLAQANSHGRTIVGLIKNTPAWASEDGTEAGVPTGLYLDIEDPANLWASFLRKVASYYGVRNVHHWIIWNEPEISPGVFGYEFAGSPRDYFRMLKVAYLVMKEIDPDAVIHLAGLTWWHNQEYLDELLTLIAQDPDAEVHDYFFDVISLHVYFRSETIKTITEEVNKIQNKHGIDKPIWINETNAPPNQDPQWPVDRPQFEVDLDQQAWFVAQAYSLGFSAGAERIGFYKLLDIHLAEGEESYGLLRPDFSKRPAYQAYKTTIENLSGFIDVSRQQGGDFFMITFRTESNVVRVLWARTPAPVTVEIPALESSAQLIEVTGSSATISPVDGAYIFTLQESTCYGECIIGGPPVFLVENKKLDDIDAAPTAASLEGVSATPVLASPTPTATATATNTPRPTKTPSPSPSPTRIVTPLPPAESVAADENSSSSGDMDVAAIGMTATSATPANNSLHSGQSSAVLNSDDSSQADTSTPGWLPLVLVLLGVAVLSAGAFVKFRK